MNIGLDFGGVISPNPKAWEGAIIAVQKKGHHVFIVSHSHPGEDAKRRQDFADGCGCFNRTFWDVDPYREDLICARKVEICQTEKIELFVDDYWGRCRAVAEAVPTCAVLYAPEPLSRVGLQMLEGIGAAP